MTKLSEFDFELPKELIAQRPSKVRSKSKLLVIRRTPKNGMPQFEDMFFSDLPELVAFTPELQKANWVRNKTFVFPARFYLNRATGGKHEIVLTKEIDKESKTWNAFIKNSSALKHPQKLYLEDKLICTVTTSETLAFESSINVKQFLAQNGEAPLPPYIKERDKKIDLNRYQTVWAEKEFNNSIAAPTASLHFDEEVLEKLSKINFCDLYLDIGLGTFSPIRDEIIANHKMHGEDFFIPNSTIKNINPKNKNFAIGTTAMRVLESIDLNTLTPAKEKVTLKKTTNGLHGSTAIFIKKNQDVINTDFLLTNFHLPKSSLFILLAAFAGSIELAKKTYIRAIDRKYRFFSYGDATLWI